MAESRVHQPEAASNPDSNRLWEVLGLRRRNWPGRYTLLLFAILLMIIGEPMFEGHRLTQGLASVSMSLVLDNGDIHHFFALHDGVHHSSTRKFRGNYRAAVCRELARPGSWLGGFSIRLSREIRQEFEDVAHFIER